MSVRIPKGTDREILEWLAKLRERKQLQSTVVEALHRMYYDERGVDTVVVPIQLGTGINRQVLKNLVSTDTIQLQRYVSPNLDRPDSSENMTKPAPIQPQENTAASESTTEVTVENADLLDALIFDAVKDEF